MAAANAKDKANGTLKSSPKERLVLSGPHARSRVWQPVPLPAASSHPIGQQLA
jgi:hypothetical protein